MKGRVGKVAVLAVVLALAVGATAYAHRRPASAPLCVSSTVDVQPRELPAKGNAPITLSSITRIRTKDGVHPADARHASTS